jgi:N-formylmaleamate deformylase
VSIPSALIVAGKGGVILAEDEQEIRSLLPSIEIFHVENAGHQMQIDDLEGLLATLGEVLNVRFSQPSING